MTRAALALGLALALAAASCGPSGPPEGPASGSALVERAVAEEEPLAARVRIADGGEVTLHAKATDERRWSHLGSWRLGPESPDEGAALEGLRAALATPLADPATRLPDGCSRARLILEVEGAVPWRHVQWAMQVGANPSLRMWRVTLDAPDGGEPVHVELPKGGRCDLSDGAPVSVRVLTVRCFRREPPAPEAPLTRLKLSADDRELPHADATLLVAERKVRTDPLLADRSAPDPVSLDLGATDPRAADAGDAARWAPVEDALRRSAEGASLLRGEIQAPPPTGGAVPYRDVFGVLRTMRRLGVDEITFQGAVAPKWFEKRVADTVER